MKQILFLIISFCLLTFVSCKKETTFEATGQILGLDEARCICCTGYKVSLSGSNDNTEIRLHEIPDDAPFSLEDATFPLSVQFNYSIDEICQGYEFITIHEIELK